MKNFFANRRRTLLVGGVINLVIPSIVVIVLLGNPLRSFARPLAASDSETNFKAFCQLYFDSPNDTDNEQTCEDIAVSFATIIDDADPNGEWPDKSLSTLQLDGISTESELKTALLDEIGDNQDQKALIDDDFIATLFELESSDLDSVA